MKVTMPGGVLDCIFEECDKFDTHETGGALIGTYKGSAMLGALLCRSFAGVMRHAGHQEAH